MSKIRLANPRHYRRFRHFTFDTYGIESFISITDEIPTHKLRSILRKMVDDDKFWENVETARSQKKAWYSIQTKLNKMLEGFRK